MDYQDFLETFPLIVPHNSYWTKWDGEKLLVGERSDGSEIRGLDPFELREFERSHRVIHEVYHLVEIEPVERIFKLNFGMYSGFNQEQRFFDIPPSVDTRKCAERECRVIAMEKRQFIKEICPLGSTLNRPFNIELDQLARLYIVNYHEIGFHAARAHLKDLLEQYYEQYTEVWFWARFAGRYIKLLQATKQRKIAA